MTRQHAGGARLRNATGRAKMPAPAHSAPKETMMTPRSTASPDPMLLAYASHPKIEVTR
jgi:hypothetical protein